MPFDPVKDSWKWAPFRTIPPRVPRPPAARVPRPPAARVPRPPAARPAPASAARAVPLSTAERAAVLHAIAQLEGKGRTKTKVRRAAEYILSYPEGSLDAMHTEIKELCREEVVRLEDAEESRKRRRSPDDDDVIVTGSVDAIDAVSARIKDAEASGHVIEIDDNSPKKAAAGPAQWPAPIPVAPPLAPPSVAPVPVFQPGDGRACSCGVVAVRRKARTEQNKGRVYYCCHHGYRREGCCGFFEWEDGYGRAGPSRAPPPGAGAGVDMNRLQLLSSMHARGELSDADFAQKIAFEFQLAASR
jgi:hypothetical protein